MKQSGREWNKTLDQYLVSIGFKACEVDPCFYVLFEDKSSLFVLVWVDDILYFSTSSRLADNFFSDFGARFEISSSGELKWFLGVEVRQNCDCIVIVF